MAAIIQGWPLWAIGLATLLPWIPLVTMEMVWTYAHYEWLALFYLLVVTQTGHFFEHVSQMFEIHVLGLHGPAARGIFGQLDVEWVHFTWNTWVVVAVVLLLTRFRGNPWLWLTLVLAGWHETEHLFIMRTYLTTGVAGSPGLLSQGGAIAGGLPLSRPDLHFIYNLLETIPLIIGFVYQLHRTYDGWLRRAFPGAPERALVSATNRCQLLRFSTGDTIVEQGEPSDRLYIVSSGEVSVRGSGADGREIELRTLGPGEFFGEIGLLSRGPRTATVRAKSAVELLTLDWQSFRDLVQSSEATAEEVARLAAQRMGNPA